MADRQVLRLSREWSLGLDELQWVLSRFKGVARTGRYAGEEKWEGVSFVSSTKAVLLRCMKEKGVPAAAIVAADEVLPETFAEFVREGLKKRGYGGVQAQVGSGGSETPPELAGGVHPVSGAAIAADERMKDAAHGQHLPARWATLSGDLGERLPRLL